mgnify:CR=1 FL=1
MHIQLCHVLILKMLSDADFQFDGANRGIPSRHFGDEFHLGFQAGA